MTYLGRIGQEESKNKLKAEESFPISENGYTLGRLGWYKMSITVGHGCW